LAAAGRPLPTPAATVMEPLVQSLVQFYDPAFPGDGGRLVLLARLLLDSCRSSNPQVRVICDIVGGGGVSGWHKYANNIK
jgi:hypothetical protein